MKKVIFLLFLGLSLCADPKICVTLRVKNDALFIKECLKSVEDIVDCLCICDLGSTDNSLKIIEEYLKKNDIPCVTSAPKEDQWYLLDLDADSKVQVGSDFNKEELKADAYL